MARPARVRIRSRKPCVFARLRLFGWNVRFTGTTPLGRSRWKAGKDPVPRWHRSTDGTGLRKHASTRLAGQRAAVTCHAASEALHREYASAAGSRSQPRSRPSREPPTRRNEDELDGSGWEWPHGRRGSTVARGSRPPRLHDCLGSTGGVAPRTPRLGRGSIGAPPDVIAPCTVRARRELGPADPRSWNHPGQEFVSAGASRCPLEPTQASTAGQHRASARSGLTLGDRGSATSRHRRLSSLGDNDGDELLTSRGQAADAPRNRPDWGRRDWLSPAGS
jgi:hypothetical protein